MKHEASELTAAILDGAFDDRPDLKRDLEIVLRDYELLWNVYVAANVVHDWCAQGSALLPARPPLSALGSLGIALVARNRG